VRHRPGLGWLLATLAVCALAAAFVLGAMSVAMSVARGAEPKCDIKCDTGLLLRPGEFQLLVRMVYAEARSDGVAGMVATAHVALNRWEDGRFGRTLGAVLTAPGQFAVGPARDERDVFWMLAIHAASGAVLGRLPDQTGSALYFFKADMARPPRWAHDFTLVSRIGSHLFFRDTVD
jgi:spore germination cell wall hydrolase CwlJ-like protein